MKKSELKRIIREEISRADAEKTISQGGFALELEDNENEALLTLQQAINKKSPELGKQFMKLMRDAFGTK